MNGTSKDISLKPSQKIEFEPAVLRVLFPDEQSSRVDYSEDQPMIKVNHQHLFEINESYSVLPGELDIHLPGEKDPLRVELKANELKKIQLRILKVFQGCSHWDWTCLGKKEVLLFEKDNPYPSQVGFTDKPILFYGSKFFYSVEGSRELKVKIPEKPDSVVFHAGKVIFEPMPVYKPGFLTDLVRIEVASDFLEGTSQDLPFDRKTVMTLTEGTYKISHFFSYTHTDGERRNQRWNIKVNRYQTRLVTFPYFLSEQKAASAQKKLANRAEKERQNQNQRLRKFKNHSLL